MSDYSANSYDPCPVCGGEMLTEGHRDLPTNTWHMRDYCTECEFEGLYVEPIEDDTEASDTAESEGE